ncbi:MAG: helix-turn-helix domain-containing protein [Candidatus Eisenbacteria sp.]|nr:helix-turn-helix domain-containing protein [Candidatus Eisenbacteria bacterium]
MLKKFNMDAYRKEIRNMDHPDEKPRPNKKRPAEANPRKPFFDRRLENQTPNLIKPILPRRKKESRSTWKFRINQKKWREGMKGLNPTQRCILIDLHFHIRVNEYAWPGVKKIAEHLEISEKTVRSNLPGLVEKGFIRIEKRYRNTHLYFPLFFF